MSYQQLLDILAEGAWELEQSKSQPPVACPRDGEPLLPGKTAGTLHCRFCGFLYPQDWVSYGHGT